MSYAGRANPSSSPSSLGGVGNSSSRQQAIDLPGATRGVPVPALTASVEHCEYFKRDTLAEAKVEERSGVAVLGVDEFERTAQAGSVEGRDRRQRCLEDDFTNPTTGTRTLDQHESCVAVGRGLSLAKRTVVNGGSIFFWG